MDSSDSTLSSLGGSSEANSMTQALKDLLKLNIAGSASIGSNANGTANPAMPIQSHSSPAGVGLDSASSSASGSINLRIKQNLMSSTNSASASESSTFSLPTHIQEEMENVGTGGGEQSLRSEDGAVNGQVSMDEIMRSLNETSTRQQICLVGSDSQNSFSVYGQEVTVISSQASGSQQPSPGSNKVKINPVVNYEWEHKHYIGNLVATHKNGIHVAYVLRGKSGGVVRVINRRTAERALLKGFSGRVIDISFAHTTSVVIGAVDEIGNMFIHEVVENQDNKIETISLLEVNRPETTPPSEYHRLIWCPFIPEDEDSSTGTVLTGDSFVVEDTSKLLVLTHDHVAEMWNVDSVSKEYGCGPMEAGDVEVGFLSINSHTKPIVDASFSPDGTALATASLDGDVKFFQVYFQDSSPPRCLHQWQPHAGHPVSCLYFLDDHKQPNPDVQYWKFAVTGADGNRELKVWSCETWTCLQTLRFMPHPDIPSNFQMEPCLKSCFDLSASYLVLSDVNRRVLYVLQLHQIMDSGHAHFSSIAEFLVTQPCLSLSVLDAGRRKFHSLPETSANHTAELTTGELAVDEEEEVDKDAEGASVGVLVKIYSVHTKALQELQIRYIPECSVAQQASVSMSMSQDESGLRDPLSDLSLDMPSSDKSEESLNIMSMRSIPSEPAASSGEPSIHSNRSGKSEPQSESQPILLTPDAFTQPSQRRSEGLSQSDALHSSGGSSLSSLTQVTAMDDGLQTPRGYSNQSQPSPGSSLTITPSSSRDLSVAGNNVTPQGLTPTMHREEEDTIAACSPIEDDAEPPHLPIPSVSEEFLTSSPSAKKGDFKPPGTDMSHSMEDMFASDAKRRVMLQSTGSSSSTSLEVSEILEGARKIGQETTYEGNTEEEEEMEEESEEADNSRVEVPEGDLLGISPANKDTETQEAVVIEEEEEVTSVSSDSREWPKAPQLDGQLHGFMEAKRLAWEALERAQADVQDGAIPASHVAQAPRADSEDFQIEGDVQIEEEKEEEDEVKEEEEEEEEEEEDRATLVRERMPERQTQPSDIIDLSSSAASGEPAMTWRGVDATAITEMQQSIQQLMMLVQQQQQAIQHLTTGLQSQHGEKFSGLERRLDTLETSLPQKVTTSLNQHSQSQSKKLQQAIGQRENQDKQKADKLMATVSDTLNRTLTVKLEEVVKREITSSVLPSLKALIEPIKQALHTELAQKLTATDTLLKENIAKLVRSRQTVEVIGQSAGNAVQGPLVSACRDTLLPAFDRSCQGLFQQLHHTFQHGTQEYLQQVESHTEGTRRRCLEAQEQAAGQLRAATEAVQAQAAAQQAAVSQLQSLSSNITPSLDDIHMTQKKLDDHVEQVSASMEEKLLSEVKHVIQESLTSAMKDTQSSLTDQLRTAMRSGAVTPVTAATPDPQQQQTRILQLLRQGQLNTAFQQALSASDLSMVMFVCETVNPSQVFNQTPCPLLQPVLLSLIQQLSADLTNNVELKHKYLEESVMNLDQSNPITKEHMPAVLGQLSQNLLAFIHKHPQDRITRNIKMLLMATQSLLK